jgi:hypothetical protein
MINISLNKDSLLDAIDIPDSMDKHSFFEKYKYFIKEGRYFGLEKVKEEYHEVDLSNFTMKSLYNLTNGSNNSSRLIVVKRYTGEKVLLEVRSSDLKPETLETILKSQRCTFYGSGTKLKKIFAHLMDDEKQSIVIDVLGWNEDHKFYSFADCIITHDDQLIPIDEMGIIQYNQDCFYLPPFGLANVTDKSFENEKKLKYRPGDIDFEKWAELFYKSSGDNAIIGMLFSIMASYRDMIFNRLGFFPYMFLFGDFGTGKSQFTARLLSMFSADTVGTPLNNSTIVGLNRTVSSICNGMFYFKEFSELTEGSAEDFMLPGYDGAGRKTGIPTQDNKTKDFPIRSAIIFDGNALPKKGSILSRMIMLWFETSKFSDEEKAAFTELRDHSKQGFGNVLREILSHRQLISDKLREYFEDAESEIKEVVRTDDRFASLKSAGDRTMQHAVLLLTMHRIFHTVLSFPVDYNTARDIILTNAANITNLLQDTSVTSIFWESFAFNQRKEYIDKLTFNMDGPINKKSAIYNVKFDPEPVLQIKLRDFYPYYVKYAKDNGIRYLDLNSLRLILTSANNLTFVQPVQKSRAKSYTDKKFGSCYQFRLTKVPETTNTYSIDGIEISL